MVLLLLACIGVPGDTGLLPPWSGTQIGEEGDDCPLTGERSEEEHTALREALALSASGTFRSEWQGEAELLWVIDPSGDSWDLVDCTDEPVQAVDVELTLNAGPLLLLERTVRLTERGAVLTVVEVEGALSPGELPEDSGQLVLELFFLPGEGSGQARWLLERPSGWEEAPAATWSLL